MKPVSTIVIGLMSGTSADGVDAAVVRVCFEHPSAPATLLGTHFVPFEPTLRELIVNARHTGSILLSHLGDIGRRVTLAYADCATSAMRSASIKPSDVAALAAHGQTLFHDPPTSIQWFDPSLLAALTGCAVVSDFRRADLAVGGQGAPLVPFADHLIFSHPTLTRVILNVGGIANITLLPAGGSIDKVIAFDTGPGNCVIDHLCRKENPNGPGIDIDGNIAAGANPSELFVERLMQHAWFLTTPPRSTDTPSFISWFDTTSLNEMNLHDQIASATRWCAVSIARESKRWLTTDVDQWVVSGGGAKNPTLLRDLRNELKNLQVMTSDTLGVPVDARESMAFAILGAATIQGRPSNLPNVTGASRPVVLGSITPRPF